MSGLQIAYLADHAEAVPILARWHHQTWSGIVPDWPLALAEAELASQRDRCAVPTTLVAFEDGRLVGSASLLDEDLPGFPPFAPWLASVFVVPDRRGRGIGSALVARVLAEARSLGIPRIYLFTTEQQRWYAAAGWAAVEARTARGASGLIMSYDLAPE